MGAQKICMAQIGKSLFDGDVEIDRRLTTHSSGLQQ